MQGHRRGQTVDGIHFRHAHLLKKTPGDPKAGLRLTDIIADAVKNVPTMKSRVFMPPISNHVPHLLLSYDVAVVGITPHQVQEKLRAHFVEKFGGEIAEAGGEKAAKFYFKDGFASRTDRSYQVTRSKFDKMLLDHAGEAGAEICEETSVDDVMFDDGGVALRIRDLKQAGVADPGSRKIERELRAKYLIDASVCGLEKARAHGASEK